MANVLVLTPGKEYIVLRKARKNYVCHDSGRSIFKGEMYVEDHINYITRSRYDTVFLKWYVNKISLKAWRGPLPRL